MKTDQLIIAPTSTAAKIARQIVHQVERDFVPEDHQAAVERAISRFANQMREAAKEELRFSTTINSKL